MEFDNNSLENKRIGEIPPIFYSDISNQKFTHCCICDCNLMESNSPYLIEKSIKNYKEINSSDTILEYAICWQCHETLSESISQESKNKILEFYENSDHFRNHIIFFLENYIKDIDRRLEHCCFSNIAIKDSEEYNIIAMCSQDKIIYDVFPMAIDFSVINELHEKLSVQTKDEIDRFKKQVTKLPPELDRLFKSRPIFI